MTEHAASGIPHEHVDHAAGVRIWKGIEQDVPHEAVDDGDRADAKGQRQHGDCGKNGRLAEGSQCVADVLPRVFHPPERSRVSLRLLDLVHTAEGAPSCEPRLVGGQPAAPKVVLEKIEVSGNFLGQVAFGVSGANQVEEPQRQMPESGHVAFSHDSSSSSLSTKLARRRQRFVWFSSARMPAFVSV